MIRMNNLIFRKTKKSRAQAMVEFALALPLLLMLLYGLLETGRLIFIYSSTVTAARQAARYGSATGESPNGVPYYRDCGGINAAAQNVGFINTFQNIAINYDTGPGTTNVDTCPMGRDAQNGDRIRVSVEAQWTPIVPLVPLDPFVIQSESARTILASVSIMVTAPAGGWSGTNQGNLNIFVSASPTTYTTLGQTILYTYTLTNTGNGDLSAPFVITDNLVASGNITCNNPPGTLTPSGSFTCTGTYLITQADLNNGSVTNIAAATANGTPSTNSATTTITAIQDPKLALSVAPDPDATSVVGTVITYTYTLTNSGNVTLTPPYAISDNQVGNVTCPATPNSLDPGQSVLCAAGYTLTSADVNAGQISNQATGTARFNAATVTSNSATATVYTTPIYLRIIPSPAVATAKDQVITYTYRARNTTNSTLNGLVVTSSRTPVIDCPTTTIPAGSAVDCTAAFTITQEHMDAGSLLTTTASATAEGGTVTSNEATNDLLIQQNPVLTAVITATPSQPTPPADTLPAGTIITYTYTLTNNGNVTLTSPIAVTDSLTTITCADQSNLAPGATRACTGTHTVTAGNVAAGSITNTGAASAKFGAQTVNSTQGEFKVVTFLGARFSVGLTAFPTTLTHKDTVLSFTYTITNTGSTDLSSPYTITHTIAITGGATNTYTFICTGISPLPPGTSTSCQTFSTVSNAVTNTVTAATVMNGAATISAANLPVSVNVPVASLCTSGALTLTKTAPSSTNGGVWKWNISNNVGSSLTISRIEIDWSQQASPTLLKLEISNAGNILPAPANKGPVVREGSWMLPTGTTEITATFDKNTTTVSKLVISFSELGCGPLNFP
jgi:uncharacterized repeat protein (TIGR01451 family)